MRVALDTNGLYTTQAGASRYIRGLAKGLRQLSGATIEIIPLAWEVENFCYRQPQRAFKTIYREMIWAKWIAPARLRRDRIDLLHSTIGALVRPPGGIREVVTLLDLAVLRQPARFRKWQRWSACRRLRDLSRAGRVICISHFTANEAAALLNLPPDKLAVVHIGYDFHCSEPAPKETPPDFEVGDKFFLFVGSLEPGKNLMLLKEVYRLAEHQGRKMPPLYIVGARWEGVPGEGPPPEGWHYLGRQPDEVLVYLYRRAVALVFPSTYEGFGLPVVEAMALGCPVICSRVASLPEVGGDAASYAEMNAADYLRCMTSLEGTPVLRDELIVAGREQAQKFSWRKCAEQTLEVYRSVLEEGS
jgi:glycosyltransferase involved in cell wall biosynthesis